MDGNKVIKVIDSLDSRQGKENKNLGIFCATRRRIRIQEKACA